MQDKSWDWADGPDGGSERAPELRTDVPHPARMYDYYLGGKDHFPADRAAAEQVVRLLPSAPTGARANRRFLGRAVRHAARAGIRQFLDVGTGIPTANNTHEVAQRLAPDARVVYVDNDPMVLTHARALLSSTPEGRTAYVDADFHDPSAILNATATKEILDLGQPVALLVVALLHFLPESDDPYGLLERYKRELAPGSMLILSHGSGDYVSPEVARAVTQVYAASGMHIVSRSHDEVERLALGPGWQPVGPGVVPVNEWQADGEGLDEEDLAITREEVAGYASVSVKAG
ncbi:SAM-dependent methyltransferase [Streptacidiphilus fuscans]|uniref:SAM-dependent methyltransferase n=1 Tax=Streptacidiphilus fuscans TaxID=2789292 RepID=A0A931B547_9ACTN|nr:SAM-dependent methyltransferase [Streptacidiphilus fuscans]MBF9070453.1 SAM-dependent methyltransferase [Streptacidiphilus fuscans]